MNKVRKLAEDLLNKNPALFTTDFDTNKRAMDQVILIRNRAMRNQIAGAITVLVREKTPKTGQEDELSAELESEERHSHSPESNVETESTSSPSAEDVKSESEEIQQNAV